MFGFLFGWSMFLVVQTGTIAAVAVAFAKFLGVFWPAIAADVYLFPPLVLGHYAISLSTQQLVALVLIVVLTVTNTRGLRLGALIQNIVHVRQDGRTDRPDRGRPDAGRQPRTPRRGRRRGGTRPANGWTSTAAYAEALPVEGRPP